MRNFPTGPPVRLSAGGHLQASAKGASPPLNPREVRTAGLLRNLPGVSERDVSRPTRPSPVRTSPSRTTRHAGTVYVTTNGAATITPLDILRKTGLNEEQAHRIMLENPRRALTGEW